MAKSARAYQAEIKRLKEEQTSLNAALVQGNALFNEQTEKLAKTNYQLEAWKQQFNSLAKKQEDTENKLDWALHTIGTLQMQAAIVSAPQAISSDGEKSHGPQPGR